MAPPVVTIAVAVGTPVAVERAKVGGGARPPASKVLAAGVLVAHTRAWTCA